MICLFLWILFYYKLFQSLQIEDSPEVDQFFRVLSIVEPYDELRQKKLQPCRFLKTMFLLICCVIATWIKYWTQHHCLWPFLLQKKTIDKVLFMKIKIDKKFNDPFKLIAYYIIFKSNAGHGRCHSNKTLGKNQSRASWICKEESVLGLQQLSSFYQRNFLVLQ